MQVWPRSPMPVLPRARPRHTALFRSRPALTLPAPMPAAPMPQTLIPPALTPAVLQAPATATTASSLAQPTSPPGLPPHSPPTIRYAISQPVNKVLKAHIQLQPSDRSTSYSCLIHGSSAQEGHFSSLLTGVSAQSNATRSMHTIVIKGRHSSSSLCCYRPWTIPLGTWESSLAP